MAQNRVQCQKGMAITEFGAAVGDKAKCLATRKNRPWWSAFLRLAAAAHQQ